ncbi:MAG TPA: hypothetical protein VH186_32910 [Chloroflexia bacterium]|nr:hypothetical protein [Chloroflexia bacterium]
MVGHSSAARLAPFDDYTTPRNLRMRVTSNLDELEDASTKFLIEQFPEILEKGRIAADNMKILLEGRTVRRTYFFSNPTEGAHRPTVEFKVTRVQAEDGGIVRLYDSEGKVREMPALIFNFVYSPGGVVCSGPDYTLLFEVVD